MAAAISWIRFAPLVPALSVPVLTGGGCTNGWSGVIGLVTGYLLALLSVRVYSRTRLGSKSTDDSRALSKNVTFGVLKNRRRREVLQYLSQADGTARLRDIAEYVAAKENDVEPDELTSAQRKRVYTTLYQCHLPMMDDAGVLEYDQGRGIVEPLDPATELFEYVDGTTGESAGVGHSSWGDFEIPGLAN